MVILTLATAAPDESVTVPSKVAFTACPMRGAENARSIVPSNRPVSTMRRLIRRPAAAGTENVLRFFTVELRPLNIPAMKERERFFITHPTHFEEVRRNPKLLELVPHPSAAESGCQARIL